MSETLIWENWGRVSKETLSGWECGVCPWEGSLVPGQGVTEWLRVAPGWSDREVVGVDWGFFPCMNTFMAQCPIQYPKCLFSM